jgi:serine/threonine protein kinase
MYKKCPKCDTETSDVAVTFCPECRARLYVHLEPGDRVEGFEIIAQIPGGEGGMATVYKARYPGSDRFVALKIARDRPYEYQALQVEAEALTKLDHPHIVKVIPLPSSEKDEKQYVAKTYIAGEPKVFIALQYIDGISLRRLLKHQGRIEPSRALKILHDIGSALSHAHHEGQVHLDVKPSNILVQPDGKAILTDFGIVRPMDAGRRRSGRRTFGTARYMSPEHITGRCVDHRSDIFSLGVVLYEMVTGKAPFDEDTTSRTVRAVVRQTPPPPSQIADVSPELERVILKAIEKDRSQRFQTTREMIAALEKAVTPKGPRRWVVPVGLAGLAGVVGLALIISNGRPSPEPTTPTPSNTALPPTDQPTIVVTTPGPAIVVDTPEPTPVIDDTPEPPPTATLLPEPTVTPKPRVTDAPTAKPVPSGPSPVLVIPEHGRSYRSPVTFRWDGVLAPGQTFLVRAWRRGTAVGVESPPLSSTSWQSGLPLEAQGEWLWSVSVVRNGSAVVTSEERMFWFEQRQNRRDSPLAPPSK